MTAPCSLCGEQPPEVLDLGASHSVCADCTTRLGAALLDRPLSFAAIWPGLVEDEDDAPEPRVRQADGTSIELRERSAELKREMSVDERMELAEMFGTLGLAREQLLECGYVLSTTPAPALVKRALAILFAEAPPRETVERLRAALFPC